MTPWKKHHRIPIKPAIITPCRSFDQQPIREWVSTRLKVQRTRQQSISAPCDWTVFRGRYFAVTVVITRHWKNHPACRFDPEMTKGYKCTDTIFLAIRTVIIVRTTEVKINNTDTEQSGTTQSPFSFVIDYL